MPAQWGKSVITEVVWRRRVAVQNDIKATGTAAGLVRLLRLDFRYAVNHAEFQRFVGSHEVVVAVGRTVNFLKILARELGHVFVRQRCFRRTM